MDFKWKIKAEQLQEQLDAAQEHAAQLEQILDACEAANAKHLSRIDHLESVYWKHWEEREELKQLCRDMYSYVDVAETHILLLSKGTCKEFRDRMEQLGLLEEQCE